VVDRGGSQVEVERAAVTFPTPDKGVAAAVSYHLGDCHEIWARMIGEPVRWRDVSDKRVVVTEATRVHGLLWDRR
jgi:hypothetical protein